MNENFWSKISIKINSIYEEYLKKCVGSSKLENNSMIDRLRPLLRDSQLFVVLIAFLFIFLAPFLVSYTSHLKIVEFFKKKITAPRFNLLDKSKSLLELSKFKFYKQKNESLLDKDVQMETKSQNYKNFFATETDQNSLVLNSPKYKINMYTPEDDSNHLGKSGNAFKF